MNITADNSIIVKNIYSKKTKAQLIDIILEHDEVVAQLVKEYEAKVLGLQAQIAESIISNREVNGEDETIYGETTMKNAPEGVYHRILQGKSGKMFHV